MNSQNILKLLPQKIKVKILRGKLSRFIAEIPSLDIFTEADNIPELFFNINDLLYTYYDISKDLQGKIYYLPLIKEKKKTFYQDVPFNKFTVPDNYSQYSWL